MTIVSINDLPTNLDQFNYQWIGQGAFHKVYIINQILSLQGYTGYFVLKIPYAINSSTDQANTAERTARKLKTLHSEVEYPVVSIKGYRLIFITEEKKRLQPNFLYVYIKNNQLNASFINAQGQPETHSLEDLECAASLKNQINSTSKVRYLTQATKLEDENSIFRKVGCPRTAILMPYFEKILNPSKDDGSLLNYLIDLYRTKRIIVLDTFGKNFAKDNLDRIVCIDTDYAIHRDSPISQQIFYKNLEIQNNFDTMWEKYEGQKLNTLYLPPLLAYMEKHLSASDIVDEYINITILSGVQVFYAEKLALLPTDMAALCLLSTRLKAQGFLGVTFDHAFFTPDFIRSFPIETSERQDILIEQAMRAVQTSQNTQSCSSTQNMSKKNGQAHEAFQLAKEDISPLTLPPPAQKMEPCCFDSSYSSENAYSALTQQGGSSLFSSTRELQNNGSSSSLSQRPSRKGP